MNVWTHRFAVFAAIVAMAWGPVCAARADGIQLAIEPQVIRLNESAVLKLTFANINPPQAPMMPDIPGFTLQFAGQESRIQITNGQQEQRITFNYRMSPRSTGKFRVGPFTMNMGGREQVLDGVDIEVLPTTGGAESGGQTIDDLVFARILLPREKVYLQERFEVELALYYRGVQLDRGIQLQNMPSTGLHLDNFEEIGSTRENIDNEIYLVRRFRMRGTALSSGEFELAPMVRVNVLVENSRSRDPFFQGFGSFFNMQSSEPLSVPAEPKKVTILPLPAEGRPDNFSGAVGKFNADIEVNPRELNAGDPVTLTVRITGRGNFETISMPAIRLGDDFRQYDPKLVAAGDNHKVFEQVFIPRSDKIKELPPVSFTYFDPDAGEYKSIVKGPVALTVHGGGAATPQMVQAPTAPATASTKDPLGIDIIDLKRTAPPVWTVTTLPGLPGPGRIATHALPVFAIAVLAVLRKRRESIDRDIGRRRRSLAPKSARASLQKAEKALAESNPAAFHEALWQAMADYTGHRANLEPGQVTPSLILDLARRGGLPEDKLAALQELLAQGEQARFGGGSKTDRASLEALHARAQDMLRALEKIRMEAP